MAKINPIESFGSAEYVAQFLLHEAFRYAHDAAAYEVASDIFGEKIRAIEVVDPSWEEPEMPNNLAEYLEHQARITRDCLDPETLDNLADAWYSSLDFASRSNRKIERSRKLQSTTDMVGHVINLTICLESILNRQLFFLKEIGQLTPELYQSIDRSELMPKLLFCFKEEIFDGRLHISGIKRLVSMRNCSVHYRVDTPKTIQPTIQEIIGIWTQLGNIFSHTAGEPEKAEIQELTKFFLEKWIS
ncbi:hypothetical protein [Leptolyngbya sp. PCC 6406]|uniref:hypothetical protein n=1 Tax=Leptolyngbya sp. PCC 6406 TaxID=1173264 RepID=UPI0002AB9A45|nr:hypothetical protein [Leptolyngbya sp. PCC 6406]